MANSTKIIIKDEDAKCTKILIIAMPKEDLLLDLKTLLGGRGIQNGTDLTGNHFNGVKNLVFMLCSMLADEYQRRNHPVLPLMEIGDDGDYAENEIDIGVGERLYKNNQIDFNKALACGHSPSLRPLLIENWLSLK